MKIKLSTGEEIEVDFYHSHDITVPRRSWETVAYILTGEKVLVTGSSRIHPKDNFSKVTGRKVALRKALVNFERPIRAEIWKALLESGMRVE